MFPLLHREYSTEFTVGYRVPTPPPKAVNLGETLRLKSKQTIRVNSKQTKQLQNPRFKISACALAKCIIDASRKQVNLCSLCWNVKVGVKSFVFNVRVYLVEKEKAWPFLFLLCDAQKWSSSPRRTPSRFSNVSRATWRRDVLGQDTERHPTHYRIATLHLVTLGLEQGVRAGRRAKSWTSLECASCHLRWRARRDSSERRRGIRFVQSRLSLVL